MTFAESDTVKMGVRSERGARSQRKLIWLRSPVFLDRLLLEIEFVLSASARQDYYDSLATPTPHHEAVKERTSALGANWIPLFVSVDVLLREVPMGGR